MMLRCVVMLRVTEQLKGREGRQEKAIDLCVYIDLKKNNKKNLLTGFLSDSFKEFHLNSFSTYIKFWLLCFSIYTKKILLTLCFPQNKGGGG